MLKVGSKAPDFSLTADDGSTVKLKDLRGRRIVLYFYPKADTPGCTVEACDFRDRQAQFAEHNAVVFGISPDPVKKLVKFRDKYALPFHLLADEDHAVAEKYGVWVEKSMYGRKYMGIARTTFALDEDGRIAKIYEQVKVKGHAESVLNDKW